MSQPIEDLFNVLKIRVDKGQNTIASTERLFATAIGADPFATKHKYKTVDRVGVQVPRNFALPAGMFKSPQKESLMDDSTKGMNLKSMTGFGPTDWWSPAATKVILPILDTAIMRDAFPNSQCEALDEALLCDTLPARTMVRKQCDKGLYISLGIIGGSLVHVHPMKSVDKNCNSWTLDFDSDARQELWPVTSITNFEVQQTRVTTPMEMALMTEHPAIATYQEVNLKRSSVQPTLHQICIAGFGGIVTPLVLTARCAFYQLSFSWLLKLTKWLGVHGPHATVVEVIETLVHHLIPGITDKQVMEILCLHTVNFETDEVLEYLIGFEGILDAFDPTGQECLQKEISDSKILRQAFYDYSCELKEYKAHHGQIVRTCCRICLPTNVCICIFTNVLFFLSFFQ